MLRALLFALLLTLGLTPTSAQLFERSETSAPSKRENAIKPELVLQSHATPGSGVPMAIHMRTAPGWHGYWLNPGDAGQPMSVEWTLPEGWKVEPLRYPVPHRLLVAGIVNYVYESDYAVLTRIVPPLGITGSHRVSAKMLWLACTDSICVPEKGEVFIDVPTSGLANLDPRFDHWLRALPRPLGSRAHFALSAGKVRLGIPLPSNVATKDPYFFPSDDGPIDYAAPQVVERNGDMVLIELTRRRGEPTAINGVLAIGEGRGLEISASPGEVPTLTGEPGVNLLWALLGAFAGGIILNLMPCVFPILGLKAMHLAKAGGDERSARRTALGYTFGAVLGTGALGVALLVIRASGEAAGWAFQLQDPRSILLLLVLVTAVTLNLLRVFEFPVIAGESNPAGSIGTGALAAFVATPCAGPFMGAALGAALLLPTWGAVLVFAALGLGLALPFLAIAFIPALRTSLPKPGPWMARLQRILAVPMALTALACLWLLWRQGGNPALLLGVAAAVLLTVLLIIVGRAQQGRKSLGWLGLTGTAAIIIVGALWLPGKGERTPLADTAWSYEAVRNAQQSGQPVFVYFTADWCLTCKANEVAAINRDETRAAFEKARVTVLVGDWTDGEPAITRFLETQGRAGVPLYLWYEPGKLDPEILPQVLTPAILSSRAARRR
jgi:DsbC/DsbD-like thiol-disulfide interchange protein/cytochrome c biogenesis protein CcdA